MGIPQKRTLLFLGHVWPEPGTTAAGQRMMQLINSFKEASYDISFATSAEPSVYSVNLSEYGVKTIKINLNDSDFDMMIGEFQPDVVIFDRFMLEEQFGWRVAEFSPKSLRILNTEDLHSLRRARKAALDSEEQCTPEVWLAKKDTLRELASILRSDLSLIISEVELEWLQEIGIIPDNLLLYLPFMLDIINTYKTDSYTPYIDRKNFMFVGHGKHGPNEDAVRYLKESIWPLIHKELPDTQLFVYGTGYSQQIQNFHDPSTGFHIAGWIENLNDVMANSRINTVPLRYGAGLKGKVISAIATGTPSVMTSIGAEGILPPKGYEFCIADDPIDFASKAIDLYTDNSNWEMVQTALQKRSDLIFDKESHHLRLHKRLSELTDSVAYDRNINILGRMLRHQSLNSQKYMAKWIELKNKLHQSNVGQ